MKREERNKERAVAGNFVSKRLSSLSRIQWPEFGENLVDGLLVNGGVDPLEPVVATDCQGEAQFEAPAFAPKSSHVDTRRSQDLGVVMHAKGQFERVIAELDGEFVQSILGS